MQSSPIQIEKYLRLKQVLEIIPVSKSTWYRGINSGLYPKPMKLSARTSAWKLSEIAAAMEDLE